MSWSGSSARSPRPRSATVRTERDSYGPALAATAEALGWSPMPWQRYVCDVASEHVAGALAYREVTVSVPRQSGKTALTLAVIVHRMLSSAGQKVAYGAQNRLAARGKLLDEWWPRLARSPLGDMFTVSRVNGSEAIRAANGSMLVLLSSDERTGHGLSLDLVVLDEVWSMDHRAEQAVRPTLATRANGQFWCLSTAGTERSVYWGEKVATGRTAAETGIPESLAYFEWSMPADAVDIGDPELWRSYHPALGFTIDERVLAHDLAAMEPSEWLRAYGNVPASDRLTGWQVISKDDWDAARW